MIKNATHASSQNRSLARKKRQTIYRLLGASEPILDFIMLPLHCKQCGRLIGRAEKHTIDGKTVCAGCFDKLGGNESTLTRGQSAFYIALGISIIAVILGLLYLAVQWFVNNVA